jgi:hypothetical protein
LNHSRSMTDLATLIAFLSLIVASSAFSSKADEFANPERVRVIRTPGGGIQPQAVVDAQGVIHLIYFKGEAARGDLFYTQLRAGEEQFQPSIRVNSQAGSAIAVGTIRGGQLALGKEGRVHIAWNGATDALPSNPSGGSSMLYARSNETRTKFEPQRNLMQRTSGLDGGGTIAADQDGNVYVAWHGRTKDAPVGEAGRRMWVARSADEGATFGPEESAFARVTGACGCCGTRALVDRRGTLYMLYRAATEGLDRDIYLLSSKDHGQHFQGESIHPWRASMCPMSSASLSETSTDVLAAWETRGEVYFCRIDPETHKTTPALTPPSRHEGRKHPALAGNARGETILVWTEGTGWQKGGALVWQVFDRSGRATELKGRIDDGVPVWGLATVVAGPDQGFTIIR